MKMTIENTTKIIKFNGIDVRVWEGYTDTGIKVHAFISRVACDKDEPRADQLRKELREMRPPSKEVDAIPLSLIL